MAGPDGALLVTEKPGGLRIVAADGRLGAPIAGLPPVDTRGKGGPLDVASPGFGTDRTRLEQVGVILRTQPTYNGDKHVGWRLAFGPDGMLYVTLGERSDMVRPQAQQMGSHLGKILRVRPDGSVRPTTPSSAGKARGPRSSGPSASATSRPPPSTRKALLGRRDGHPGRRRAEPDREGQEPRLGPPHMRIRDAL